MNDYQTTRIWTETLEKLRMIYALTGESQVSIIDRLVTAELSKLQEKTMINISDRYGDAVAVEIEDYQELNPDGEFSEYDEVIREKVDGEWEIIAVSETEYERQ